MRRFLTLVLPVFLISYSQIYSQAPAKLKYQAIVRDSLGSALTNQLVRLRTSVLSGSNVGPAVYIEEYLITTSEFGLVNLNVGAGAAILGSLDSILWGAGSHFLQIELDVSGGTNFVLFGSSELMSVPYALYANDVLNKDDADADPSNELQTLSISGSTVSLSNGGQITIPADQIDDADADPLNEIQAISISGDTVFLANGGAIVLPTDQVDDADADPTNEIQILSTSGDTLFLSDGGFAIMASGSADNLGNHTADSDVNLNGHWLNGGTDSTGIYITSGGAVGINTSSPTQFLHVEGSIKMVDGNQGTDYIMKGNSSGVGRWESPAPDPTDPVPILYQGDIIYVHPTDNCTNVARHPNTTQATGAYAEDDGETNTNLIHSANSSNNYANEICYDLFAHSRSDWYLPSKLELVTFILT